MNFHLTTVAILLGSVIAAAQLPGVTTAQDFTATDEPTIDEVKSAGALRSSYRKSVPQAETFKAPQADLEVVSCGDRTNAQESLLRLSRIGDCGRRFSR